MEWKDATSYRQGDRRNGKEPNAWRCKLNDCSIWIGTQHLHNMGRWSMTCQPWFDAVDLVSGDYPKEQVQEMAVNAVKTKLQSILDQLDA